MTLRPGSFCGDGWMDGLQGQLSRQRAVAAGWNHWMALFGAILDDRSGWVGALTAIGRLDRSRAPGRHQRCFQNGNMDTWKHDEVEGAPISCQCILAPFLTCRQVRRFLIQTSSLVLLIPLSSTASTTSKNTSSSSTHCGFADGDSWPRHAIKLGTFGNKQPLATSPVAWPGLKPVFRDGKPYLACMPPRRACGREGGVAVVE